jgi:hypothetical protein
MSTPNLTCAATLPAAPSPVGDAVSHRMLPEAPGPHRPLAIPGQGVRLPVTSGDVPPCGQSRRRSRKAARAYSCGLNYFFCCGYFRGTIGQWTQISTERKAAKNRLHLDIGVSGGRAVPIETRRQRVDAEAARLASLGALLVGVLYTEGLDHYAVAMKDPEGNEFDIN